MSLKLIYYGQNDGSTVPDVVLTGDPGTDQTTLTAAGFFGGVIVALQAPVHATNTEVAIVPCDSNLAIPYATLINGPGEFAGAIGPSGSRKAPVVRALWQGIVDSQAYDTLDTGYALGAYLYCGHGATTGLYVAGDDASTTAANKIPVGICTHVPSASEPWLGIASLL